MHPSEPCNYVTCLALLKGLRVQGSGLVLGSQLLYKSCGSANDAITPAVHQLFNLFASMLLHCVDAEANSTSQS